MLYTCAGDREDNGGVRVDVREVARAAGPRGQRHDAGRAGRAQAHLVRRARGRHAAARAHRGRAG